MIGNVRSALGGEVETTQQMLRYPPFPPVGLNTSNNAAVFTGGNCNAEAHTAASLSSHR